MATIYIRKIGLTPHRQSEMIEHFVAGCQSSKQLGLLSLISNRGYGSSWIDVKPLGADGSSGGFG